MSAPGVQARSAEATASEVPPALQVQDLRVSIQTDTGLVQAIGGVSFDVRRGEFLCMVGESGSGKSVSFLSILGLLQTMVKCTVSGRFLFGGRDLSGIPAQEMRRLLGGELSIVFQDPLSALNPVFRVGTQIADVVRSHEPDVSQEEALRRAVEVMERVRIPNARARADDYPHQFSGGMRQRVLIAMAIVCRPKLLIADEPTTALDVTVQAEILALLEQLRRELSMSIVLITHDLGLVARYADRVVVMYAGRIIEQSPVAELFTAPAHPYTTALLDTVPRIGNRSKRLLAIAGEAPNIRQLPPGCAFEPRCDRARGRALCLASIPALAQAGAAGALHLAACHFLDEARPGKLRPPTRPTAASTSDIAASTDVILRVENLDKRFVLAGGRGAVLHAVRDVSFELMRGETLGIVGESGSGKSTMARCIMQLIEPSAGRITFEGERVDHRNRRALRRLRDRMQLVFQDSRSALNPRMTVEAIVGEPLAIRGQWRKGGAARVMNMLARVGLAPEHAHRYPHEFSGGQQQRIGIARALILSPAMVVLDEPISSLDVSIRAQIINLLEDLQAELGLSYLFIAHDLSVVHHISDRVAVMYLGRIVEIGSADSVCRTPRHPYTKLLVEAVPEPDPAVARSARTFIARGARPDPISPPSGCSFRSRCAHAEVVAAVAAQPCVEIDGRRLPDRCVSQMPELLPHESGGLVACHYAG